jgi:hypothetical protein
VAVQQLSARAPTAKQEETLQNVTVLDTSLVFDTAGLIIEIVLAMTDCHGRRDYLINSKIARLIKWSTEKMNNPLLTSWYLFLVRPCTLRDDLNSTGSTTGRRVMQCTFTMATATGRQFACCLV